MHRKKSVTPIVYTWPETFAVLMQLQRKFEIRWIIRFRGKRRRKRRRKRTSRFQRRNRFPRKRELEREEGGREMIAEKKTKKERDSIRSLMELVYETLAATCGRWTELRLTMTWPGFPSAPSQPTQTTRRSPLSLPKLWASLQDTAEIAYHVRNSGRFELGSVQRRLNSAAQAREIG